MKRSGMSAGFGLIIALVITMSSCSFARDVRYFTSPVWSETGSGIAYVDLEHRERDVILSSVPHKWNEVFRVMTASAPDADASQWGPEVEGWPVEIYYQNQEGYIMLNWYDRAGEYISIIYSDGRMETVVGEARLPSENLVRAYPSPDGSIIAVVWPELECSPGVWSSECSYEEAYGQESFFDPEWFPPTRARLRFLNSASLSEIRTFSYDFNSYLDFRWSASQANVFVITDTLETNPGEYEYVLFRSDGVVDTGTDEWGSFAGFPHTASSPVNDSRQLIQGNGLSFEVSSVSNQDFLPFSEHRF